jgi:hypothetical protein
MAEKDEWPELGTRDVVLRFLASQGYPTSASTLDQLCAPSRNEGPVAVGYWGRRPVYRLADALTWAQARLRDRPHQLHPKSHQTGPPPSA